MDLQTVFVVVLDTESHDRDWEEVRFELVLVEEVDLAEVESRLTPSGHTSFVVFLPFGLFLLL